MVSAILGGMKMSDNSARENTFASSKPIGQVLICDQTRCFSLVELSYFLTLIALVLSPFYFGGSGRPQISNVVMAIAAILNWISTKPRVEKWWASGLCFAAYTILVDLLVFVAHCDQTSIQAPLYYMYNFLIWVHLVTLSSKIGTGRILKSFNLTLWAVFAMELLLVVTGTGRMFGVSRAMGTFNDPNQMANWIVCAATMLAAIGWAINRSWVNMYVATGMATIAVAYTASRSGALGLLPLILSCCVIAGYWLISLVAGRKRVKIAVLALSCVLVIVLSVCLIAAPQRVVLRAEAMMNRITNWLGRFRDTSSNTSFEGRGYDRLWKFPEYLLLGAGEGANHRWETRTIFSGEIHSTPAGVLFCYGLPGTFCLGTFLYKTWSGLPSGLLKFLLLAPLLYGLGTYNLRNWCLWIVFAIFNVITRHVVASHGESRSG